MATPGLRRRPTTACSSSPPCRAKTTWCSHGAAGFEVVAVYSEPSKESTRLGFLRIGTRMRIGEKVKSDEYCGKGWHAIEGGGYACASKGLLVDKKPPYMSHEPKPPRKDDPYPYDWAYVRQWNHTDVVEGPERRADQRDLRAGGRSARPSVPVSRCRGPSLRRRPHLLLRPRLRLHPRAAETEARGAAKAVLYRRPMARRRPRRLRPILRQPIHPPVADPPPADPPPADPPEEEVEEEPVYVPFSASAPWLEKGYFLSLGESMEEGGRGYWRTARGGVVEKKHAWGYEPKDFVGSELTEDMSFPVGFVMVKGGTKLMTLDKNDKLVAKGTLDKRTFLDLGEEVEINGRAYFTIIEHPEGEEPSEDASAETGEAPDPGPVMLVKADVIRQPELQPIPKGLEPWDRWIDVDISKQMLVAYEGARPVYVTLVSTGKKGTDEEPFETPTGRFRVRSKQLTSNMDGTTATDGNYAIQDVPWVMYFEGSYALHGAFWHRSFGSVRSHGCVNLGPSDARWLWYWTTPFVPEMWHGAAASDENPGTTIVIRKSEG